MPVSWVENPRLSKYGKKLKKTAVLQRARKVMVQSAKKSLPKSGLLVIVPLANGKVKKYELTIYAPNST
jgi:hypothetical protein